MVRTNTDKYIVYIKFRTNADEYLVQVLTD